MFIYQPIAKDLENVIKLIVELLNAENCDTEELYSLLKIELKNRKDVSEIISEIWPEMVTDKARHRLCEFLIKTDIRPQIVCERIYIPWVSRIDIILSKLINSNKNQCT